MIGATILMNSIDTPKYNGHRKYQYSDDMQADIDSWFKVQYSDLATKTTKRGNIIQFVRPPFFGRMCREALDLNSSQSVSRYIKGEYDDEINNYSDVITRAKQRCHDDILEGAAIGIYNERVVSLVLQSWFNYSTKSEVTTTGEVIHRPQTKAELIALIEANNEILSIE
jgi:hypothetical protein